MVYMWVSAYIHLVSKTTVLSSNRLQYYCHISGKTWTLNIFYWFLKLNYFNKIRWKFFHHFSCRFLCGLMSGKFFYITCRIVTSKRQCKRSNFLINEKFVRIFQVKLFLLIQGNTFLEFFLYIRVPKFFLYKFPIISIFLPFLPNDFKC